MFENLGWPEIAMLLLIALFVIGPERLPKVLGDLGRGIRKLRSMASNATADISREVGTDIDITDLHPKTFIRKHILSEADEEALKNPLKSALKDLQSHTKPLQDDLTETASGLRSVKLTGNGASGGKSTEPAGDDVPPSSGNDGTRFDVEAT